jgi:hemerythrin superfamily protein
MSEKNILSIMVDDHKLIEKLLDDLEGDIDKNYKLMKKSFTKFEWKLEKHIFSEEKVIFTNYNPMDVTEGYRMLPELTKQHNYILNQLSNWRKDLISNNKIEGFFKFKKVLINHKIFEENELYPKLDQSLSDADKKLIIDRLNEIK